MGIFPSVKEVSVMEDSRPGYYAIIPADVRYDDRIPANAKLLYGEVSALIGADGFCFASNQYFAQIYGMSVDSISRLFKKLEEHGYIKRELEKDKSGQVVRRKIFLSVSIPRIQPPDNFADTPRQNCGEGTCKKVGDTNLSNTNNNPPNPPEGVGEPKGKKNSRQRSKAQAETLPVRFDGFWLFYRQHVPPDRNAGNRQKAIRAWDKLAPDAALADTLAKSLAKQVKTEAWKSGIGVPHASTWLNNRGWEDDWGAAAQEHAPADRRGEEWLN